MDSIFDLKDDVIFSAGSDQGSNRNGRNEGIQVPHEADSRLRDSARKVESIDITVRQQPRATGSEASDEIGARRNFSSRASGLHFDIQF